MAAKRINRRAPFRVETEGLVERKILEAQLLSYDHQLKKFEGTVRPLLLERKQDPVLAYQRLVEARARTRKKLGSTREPAGGPRSLPPPFPDRGPLAAWPVTGSRVVPGEGLFGFGTSGSVRATEFIENVYDKVRAGPHPMSGDIQTVARRVGGVQYRGIVEVGPSSIAPSQFNTNVDYFWVKNWVALVVFPAPTTRSVLTYRFSLGGFQSLFNEAASGMFSQFASVGETAKMVPYQTIPVNRSLGWLMQIDLQDPGSAYPYYNGHYGIAYGDLEVQRSFEVAAGNTPAIAVLVGSIVSMAMMGRLRLSFGSPGDGSLSLYHQQTAGRVDYHYQPVWDLAQA